MYKNNAPLYKAWYYSFDLLEMLLLVLTAKFMFFQSVKNITKFVKITLLLNCFHITAFCCQQIFTSN